MVRHALISVYHKEGIVEFARGLLELDFKLLSSGGTAKVLADAGLPVTDIATIVGEPILGHRVVTLSREIHAGILARDIPEDIEELERLGIPRIDLVCVDFYPLVEATEVPDATTESVIEKTDIGGPTMVRSAAKARRIVISAPKQRESVLAWLKSGEPNREAYLNEMAADAEMNVGLYCLTSARFHSGGHWDAIVGIRGSECGYGENAWQTPAVLYGAHSLLDDPLAIPRFKRVEGGPPSYNNLCDLDRALQTITHIAAAFERSGRLVPHIAVGVKHGNACGAAVDAFAGEAIRKMVAGDPRALFGGVVMTNFAITQEHAELMQRTDPRSPRRIFDMVAAPSFEDEAVAEIARKTGKARVLVNPALANLGEDSLDRGGRFRYVRGGYLRQPNYTFVLDLKDPSVVVYQATLLDLFDPNIPLAWAVGSTSNSNTVTLAKGDMIIGNAVGQQDSVSVCELALKRARDAGHDPMGAVAYRDSFFAFSDGPEVLARAGVTTILATSGSVRDEDVIKTCKQFSVNLIMVPDKLARGFFGH